jgi:glycosyltransferase involved in cell wall biosynthesis
MLETVERLIPPAGGWKVVAVDNGSSDDTLSILEKRAARLPMSVVSEPRPGKNIALNAGLALVEGDIVALTDDDILLPVDWLVAIERVAGEKPDYDILGGPISPVWEEPPPDWVSRCVPKGLLGLTDFAEGPVDPHLVWGGNMAVRTAVFHEHKFAEGIGPNGSAAYAKGSEINFTVRAAKRGHRCWHFHAAPVGHIIRPYQLEPDWLLQRAYNQGRGNRRVFHGNNDEALVRLFGYPLRRVLGLVDSVRNVATAACSVATTRLLSDFDAQFRASSKLRYCQGDFAERLAMITVRQMSIGDGRPNS